MVQRSIPRNHGYLPSLGNLRQLKNILLTPHIGGSTEEAQSAIGVEVAEALVKYVNFGTTVGAVNLPEVSLRSLTLDEPNHVRVVYIHKNVPGVLRQGMSNLPIHTSEEVLMNMQSTTSCSTTTSTSRCPIREARLRT